jgi:hypothetical protein
MLDDGECGAVGGMRIRKGNRSTRRKTGPEPVCPPQIPHDLTWARTRAAVVGSRRLTHCLVTVWPEPVEYNPHLRILISKMCFNTGHLSLSRSWNCLFLFRCFNHMLYSYMRISSVSPLPFIMISSTEYKLWSPWLCNFLDPSVTSSLIGPAGIAQSV